MRACVNVRLATIEICGIVPFKMIELLDLPFVIEEEEPPLEYAMPQVFRQPRPTSFIRGSASIHQLLTKAQQANHISDTPAFGKAYGELFVEFQPAIEWAVSCWEYLLSTEGCRFVLRSLDEKRYARGDYRIFTEKDFRQHVHRSFKECLLGYLSGSQTTSFLAHLKTYFWPDIIDRYRNLENPPDSDQRRLTGLSYLRCVPYRFLNSYHHDRVTSAVNRLACEEKEVVQLYYLNFCRQEAAAKRAQISRYAFWRRRALGMRELAENDYLSFVLLTQIERY